MATTMRITLNEAEPLVTFAPVSRSSCASTRPCDFIQIWCQPNMSAASIRTPALKYSCPAPAKAAAIRSANKATTLAAVRPATIPPTIHLLARAAAPTAASSMPTTSAASSVSRSTMMAEPSMGQRSSPPLFRDDPSARELRVEIAEILVFSGSQRSYKHGNGCLARYDFFAIQVVALKLFGRHIAILDDEANFLTGWDLKLSRQKSMLLDDQFEFRQAVRSCRGIDAKKSEPNQDNRALENRGQRGCTNEHV